MTKLIVPLLSLVACGQSGPTLEDLEAARGRVNPMQRWEEAQPRLETALGAPHTATDAAWTWVGRGADGCKALEVTRMGDLVGSLAINDVDCPP